jgi:hypothetical protein
VVVGVTVNMAFVPEQTVWLLTVAAVSEFTRSDPAVEVIGLHEEGVTTHSYWLLSAVPDGAETV